jgi:hypothetical protein
VSAHRLHNESGANKTFVPGPAIWRSSSSSPSSSIHASVKYHYRQPNLSEGKDESKTWGADPIKRSLPAGQHRGSTSAFRGALCALVANRTGRKTLLLRPN